MRVLITGSSGFVGSSLVPFLTSGGHDVVRLLRKGAPGAAGSPNWDPGSGRIDPTTLEGCDAIVHLAGENIAEGRWTAAKKARIRSSRVDPTRRAWEDATRPASEAGIRVVNLRFGVVLGLGGGALAKMIPPFRAGAGGPIGSGRQYGSWVTLDDAIGAIGHALATEDLRGPVNVVAPHPVTNAEFTRTLGKVLSRPAIVPMPAFAARLAFGEMADALLLASTRVQPARLIASGYRFHHPDLEPALRHLLGRPAPADEAARKTG